MATPRKRWFRVADSILREDLTAEQRSTFLGLLAWFNQRRQRDGYQGIRAQEASIPPGDLLTITLAETLEGARKSCLMLAERFELTVETRGAFTFIRWPNLAKFQEWQRPSAARRLPASRPRFARESPLPAPTPTPAPKPSPKREEEEQERSPAARDHVLVEAHDYVPPAWEAGIRAAVLYDRNASRWKLTGERRRHLAALLRSEPARGADAFAHVVHGYIARHQRMNGTFDPMHHFTADTLLRAGKRQERLEAYDRAISQGQTPPFALVERVAPRLESFAERESRELADWVKHGTLRADSPDRDLIDVRDDGGDLEPEVPDA